MMAQDRGLDPSPDDDAAFWFARMRSERAGPRDRARFGRWLASDPANAAAYADYEGLWVDFQETAADETILAMRKDALALGPEPRHYPWHKFAALAATVAMFLLAGIVLLQTGSFSSEREGSSWAQARDSSIYRTEVGQRSTVTLADGSVIELNTDSVLQVDYAERRRNLRLLRGQALFDVAHDTARPFVVEAGDRRITALGTSFDVRFRSGETRVTLIEGKVTVEPLDGPEGSGGTAPLSLEPGQQLIASAARPIVVRQTNVEQAVSWRTGRVIFSDEPLEQVVEEINRYSARKVVLADASLGELRVSGVFRAGSVHNFVTALDATFPVASRTDEARNVILLTRE